MIFLTDEKQQEVRKLMMDMAESHVSRANVYKVEFYEVKGNAITKLSACTQDGEEIINVQNIMTKQGFDTLERMKGWTAWAVELIEVLKKALARPAPVKKKFWLWRLLIRLFK